MSSVSWWFRILLLTATAISVTSSRNIYNQLKSDRIYDSIEEDIDLEYAIDDYYDELLDELQALSKELRLEKLKMLEVNQVEDKIKLLLKEKIDLEEEKRMEQTIVEEEKEIKKIEDYDYMSDSPASEPESSRDTKLPDSLILRDGNFTWPLLYPNGSYEDPALAKVHRERPMDPDAIDRTKELRLNIIRSKILELRGGNSEVNRTVPYTKTLQEAFENHKELIPNASTNGYTEKVQSFFPSCDVPKHTDDDAWKDPSSMNLLFDVAFPTASAGSAITVLTARIRLYKIVQTNSTVAAHESAGMNYQNKSEKSLLNQYGVISSPHNLEDDRLLRMSVYWYTRALKRNRVKRKLMDSKMFNTTGGEWVEFNIRTAVRAWKDSGKNYGLIVTVEDEDGALLQADKYIHPMNCSKDAVGVRAMPVFMTDATKKYMLEHPDTNQTQNDRINKTEEVNPFPNYVFPTLTVHSMEVPDHEDSSALTKIIANAPTGYSLMIARNDRQNATNLKMPASPQERPTMFNTVGLGSPAAGPNRNNLVPILTKSDVVTSPEDIRMKNEMLKVQAERTDPPRRRHSRKHV